MENQKGFTLVELIVVLGLVFVLLGLSWVNFTSLPSRATLQTDSVALVNDLKSQQMQAMTGDTNGGGVQSAYGVHFETTSYTFFKGDTYSPGASGNFITELGNANLSFTNILFPDSAVVFAKGSGEIVGYIEGSDSVTITDSLTNTTKTIRLNQYGSTY